MSEHIDQTTNEARIDFSESGAAAAGIELSPSDQHCAAAGTTISKSDHHCEEAHAGIIHHAEVLKRKEGHVSESQIAERVDQAAHEAHIGTEV